MKDKERGRGRGRCGLVWLLAVCSLLHAPCFAASVISSRVVKTRVNTVKKTSFDAAQLLYHWTFDGNDIDWANFGGVLTLYPRIPAPGGTTNFIMSFGGSEDQQVNVKPGTVGQAQWYNGFANRGWVNPVTLSNVSLMTISMWLKPDNVASWVADKMVIEGGVTDWGAQTNSIIIDVSANGAGRAFSLGIRDPADVSKSRLDYFLNTNGFPVSNTWYHCAFIFNNTTTTGSCKAYVNAAAMTMVNLVNTKSAAGNFGRHYWSFGGRGSGAFFYNGWMDDIRIYTNELTQAQVSELYTNRFSVIR